LTWENLKSHYLSVQGHFESDDLMISGALGRGYIYSGDNQDSDYNLDDRQGEFSRSNNTSDGDGVYDREVRVGLMFIENRPVRLGAGLGYASRTVDLIMRDGFQTIPATGPIYNLRSTYSANLSGPVTWFSFNWRLRPSLFVGAERRLGFFSYTGNANWNLRSEFQHPRSFSQHTNGLSDSIALSLDWLVSARAALLLNYNYQTFRAEGGYTRFYLADGTTPQQPIHEVKYWMWVLTAGVAVLF
jgi:hypothetical protein